MKLLVLLPFALHAAFAYSAEPADTSEGWKQVAEGVFESTDANGVTTRMAYGDAGAQFDRQVIESEIAAIRGRMKAGTITEADDALLRAHQDALDGLPVDFGKGNDFGLMTSSTGLLCSTFRYALDSHLMVGGAGALAVSRAAFSERQPGPVLPVTSETIFSRATVTPSSGSPITVSNTTTSSAGGPVPVLSIADYEVPALPSGSFSYFTSASCSASTYASISIASQRCTGGTGFVSQTKSYPTCVSTP